MAMVQHGTMMAANAAGWCETKLLRAELAVIRAPLASVCLALLAGAALGLCVLRRTSPLQAFVKAAR
jgi:hypothetical protein